MPEQRQVTAVDPQHRQEEASSSAGAANPGGRLQNPSQQDLAERLANFGNLEIKGIIADPRRHNAGSGAIRREKSRGRAENPWYSGDHRSRPQWEQSSWEASPQRRTPAPWSGDMGGAIGHGRSPSTDGRPRQNWYSMAPPPPPQVALQIVHKAPNPHVEVITWFRF